MLWAWLDISPSLKMAAEPVVVPSTLAALAEEATKKNDEKKEKTRELTRDMFDKVADYVNGELASKSYQ